MHRWRKVWCLFGFSLIVGIYIGSLVINLTKRCHQIKYHFMQGTTRMEEFQFKEDESNMDDLLFVGVMTDRKFLETRARAIYRTWADRIPGKVVFFIGEGQPYYGDMNVVELNGVSENAYPPQKKSFAMLEYIGKHYANRYKWLMRVDDDVYIKPQELGHFLASINDTKFRYIGQPGYGRPKEKGRLGLVGAFCMGGPGVVMSGPLLQHITPGLSSCLTDVATSHEDTEVGRCVARLARLPCTQAYEMQYLFYQNYEELHLSNSSFKKDLGKPELKALTLHPVKDSSYVFRLDNFINIQKLQTLKEKIQQIRLQSLLQLPTDYWAKDFIKRFKMELPKEKWLRRSQTGRANLDSIQSLPKGGHHLHTTDYWECVKGTTIHSPRLVSAKMIFPVRHRGRQLVQKDIVKMVQNFLRHDPKHRPKHFDRMSNFQYQKLSPSSGIVGIVFVDHKENGTLVTRPFLYKRPFDRKMEFREAIENSAFKPPSKNRIVLIMTLFKRFKVYQHFLHMYAKAASGYKGSLELRVVVFKDELGEHLHLTKFTSMFKISHPKLNIETIYSAGNFNRGKGLTLGMQTVADSSLLLFMDSDMTFSARFLERVSTNTIRKHQAFFPIYFTPYDPTVICYNKTNCNPQVQSKEEDVGFWRSFSYGIGSIYKSDLLRCGGFRTNITGWGLEDVDLYEKCLRADLVVMRVVDTGIIHRYHARECDASLPEGQLESCRLSGAKMLGSVKSMQRIIHDLEQELVDPT